MGRPLKIVEDPSGQIELAPRSGPRGEVELVFDGQHYERVVRAGLLRARASLELATADLKGMLIPRPGQSRAPALIEVLAELAAGGVEVRLLHSGVPSSAALHGLRRRLPANLTLRRCPRLHAKAVVVDGRWMYLGSANLTGAGLGAKGEHKRNFEMGIITESAEMIEAVLHHFNRLWEGRHCAACRRREVCPVPLEEPRL